MVISLIISKLTDCEVKILTHLFFFSIPTLLSINTSFQKREMNFLQINCTLYRKKEAGRPASVSYSYYYSNWNSKCFLFRLYLGDDSVLFGVESFYGAKCERSRDYERVSEQRQRGCVHRSARTIVARPCTLW